MNIEPSTVATLAKRLTHCGSQGSIRKYLAGSEDLAADRRESGCIFREMTDQIVPILSLGGKGVISVLSNVAPRETHDICASFFAGDIAGSRALQLKALPLIEALFCEVNPIPVKKAVNLMGMEVGGLRMPLTELSEAHTVQLKKAMQEFGIQLA